MNEFFFFWVNEWTSKRKNEWMNERFSNRARPNNQPTNRPTDRASYWGAKAHLKTWLTETREWITSDLAKVQNIRNKTTISKHGSQSENLTPKLRHTEGYQIDPFAYRIYILYKYYIFFSLIYIYIPYDIDKEKCCR